MMEAERQRMILRRIGQDAPSSAEIAMRVNKSPTITLLQETPPSTLLVEGTPETISQAIVGVPGWTALPVIKYQVPDPRPRVLKPAAG